MTDPPSDVNAVEQSRLGPGLWLRWTVATGLAWVVGVLIAIALSDLVVNRFFPRESNLILGLCAGIAIGLAQQWAIRPIARLGAVWVYASAIIMALPFIAFVVLEELGIDTTATAARTSLVGLTLVGGLLGASLQARELGRFTARHRWWVGALAVSWGAAILADVVLGFMAVGFVLGAVSGALLVQLLRTKTEPT